MYLNYSKIYKDYKNKIGFPECVYQYKNQYPQDSIFKVVYNGEKMNYEHAKKISEEENKVLIVKDELRGEDKRKYFKKLTNEMDNKIYLFNTMSIPRQRYDFIIKNYERYDLLSPKVDIPDSILVSMIDGGGWVYDYVKRRNYSKIISDYFLHKKKKVMYIWETSLIVDMMFYDYINNTHCSDRVFKKYFRSPNEWECKSSFILKELKVVEEKMNFSSYMYCLYNIFQYFQKKFKERDTYNYYMIVLIIQLFHFSIKHIDNKKSLENITDEQEYSVLLHITPEFIQNLRSQFYCNKYLICKFGYHCGYDHISMDSYKEFVEDSKGWYSHM